MKQKVNKRSEALEYGSLDALLLSTDLIGRLMYNDASLPFSQLSELSPTFLSLLSSKSPYSLDINYEGHTYRVKGKQYDDRIDWHFTDITDLTSKQNNKYKNKQDNSNTDQCQYAQAIPGSGAYPQCHIAKDEINLRLVLEESKQYIALFDEDLRLSYCNQHYIEAVYDNEEVLPQIGEKVLDRLSPEQRDFWYNWFERVRKGEEITFEVAYRGKRGELIYLDTHLKPLMIDDHIRGIIQFTTNITEKKKLDQQLIETEERLRMATEAAHIGVFDYRVKEKELVWDKQLQEMFSGDQQLFIEELKKCIKSQHPSGSIQPKLPYFDFESVMPVGSEFKYIESYGRVFYDSQQHAERITGISLDLTDFRQTEIFYRESQINLRAIFDSSPNAHFLIDKDFNLLSSNKVGNKLIWEVFQTRPDLGDFFMQYVPSDFRDDFMRLFGRALQKEEVERVIDIDLPNKGNRWFKLIFKPAYYENKMVGVIFSANDITEQVTAKKENERLLNIICDLPTEVYLINGQDFRIEFVNEEVTSNVRWQSDELKQKRFYELQPRLGKEGFMQLMQGLFTAKRKKIRYKTQQQRKDGSEYSVEVYLQKAGVSSDSLLAFVVDITENEKIQSDLRDIEQNYKQLIDNVPGFVTLLNPKGEILFKNQANIRQLSETSIEHSLILKDCKKRGLDLLLKETLASRETTEFESQIYSGTSTICFIHQLVPIIKENDVNHVMMISTDITAQKNQELQLRHSLEERDALLKEIHHRVKNNLQIISSMLYLKSTQLHDTESRQVMEECNRRIRSMHMIHELLLQEQNLSCIDPGMYLEKLIHEVYHSFRLPEQEIHLECDIAQLEIGANKVMTIAMIIYELLSNALQHAFVGRDQGTITIRLTPSSSTLNLCVVDDGIGIPESEGREESLGMLLVKTFATQIKASLKMNTGEEGTHFCIQFNSEK